MDHSPVGDPHRPGPPIVTRPTPVGPAGSPLPTTTPAAGQSGRPERLLNQDDRVGPYKLVRYIRHGAFGEVWVGCHTFTGVFCAVKAVPDGAAAAVEVSGVSTYLALAREYPGLVPVTEFNHVPGGFYNYSMPLADDVRGRAVVRPPADYDPLTLERYRELHRPLPIDRVLAVLRHLLPSLQALHDAGLVHRDIKPANAVRIGGVWKLCDVGLVARRDRAGGVCGTPWFIPPEGTADRRADVYALGRTVFLLATGYAHAEFDRFVAGGLPFPGADDRRDAVRAVIARACAPDAAQRYQTAAEMLAAVGPLVRAVRFTLVVNEPFSSFTPVKLRQLIAACRSEGFDVCDDPLVEPGSVRVTFDLPPEDAARLEALVHTGAFARWNVVAAEWAGTATPTTGREECGPNDDRPADPARPASPARPQNAKRRFGYRVRSAIAVAAACVLVGMSVVAFMLPKPMHMPGPGEGGVNSQKISSPPAIPMMPKQETPPSGDADRVGAEYVIRAGGTAQLNHGDQMYRTLDALPAGPFRLTHADLTNCPRATDDGLAALKGCRDLTGLDLALTPVTDAGLAHFKGHTELTLLSLMGTAVTDAGVSHFRNCKRLISASLSGCTRVGDDGLAALKDCKDSLTSLNLAGTRATDAGLAHFAGTTKLRFLSLAYTAATDTGVAHFAANKELRELNLAGLNITDGGLAPFRHCSELAFLSLTHTRVTDDGLAHFRACERLGELHLRETSITDDAAGALAGLTALHLLDVRKTGVTAKGVTKVRDALPKCAIVWDGGRVEPKSGPSP